MKDREELIAFHRNYCRHYTHGEGADMVCAAGMALKTIKNVPTGPEQIKWGPCIEGHTLADPLAACPHWERRTREEGEKYADSIASMLTRMAIVGPCISAWREKPKPKTERREVIECPVCKGTLHVKQSAYNGHVHAHCESDGCVSFME